MKIKNGDKIIVIGDSCCHSYKIGAVLTINSYECGRYHVKEGCSYLRREDFVHMIGIKII